MLVVLDGARGVPEPIELPKRLDSCAAVWPLREALEREISEHGQDIEIHAEHCEHLSSVVLGWWVRLMEELAQAGRRLTFIGLRPEFVQAMELLRGGLLGGSLVRGALVDSNEIPKAAPNRRVSKAKLPR